MWGKTPAPEKSLLWALFEGFNYIIPLRHKWSACFQKMSLKIPLLRLKITKSQDLLFENGTFPTLEGHQNQTEAHRALDFFLLRP